METHEGPFGIEFIKIPSGICEIGTNKGGWIYASERPKYRASLPAYSIMKAPITLQQAAEIFDEKKPEGDFLLDNVDHTIIHDICRIISKESDFEVKNRQISYHWQKKLAKDYTLALRPETAGTQDSCKASFWSTTL